MTRLTYIDALEMGQIKGLQLLGCKWACDNSRDCKNCLVGKAITKLAEYEDLEEQGLLLRLPCKVGDVIYKLWYKPCRHGETYPDSYECCGCEDECDLTREITEFVVPDLDWLLTNIEYLGDLVYFITREEAEAKLKEMGE